MRGGGWKRDRGRDKQTELTRDRKRRRRERLLCFCSNSVEVSLMEEDRREALLSGFGPCVASVCCFPEGAVNQQLL